MKFKALLSILFVIATTFTAIHEVNHIYNQDTIDCVMCIASKNLASADIVDFAIDFDVIHFDKILQSRNLPSLYNKKFANQNRAPPKLS